MCVNPCVTRRPAGLLFLLPLSIVPSMKPILCPRIAGLLALGLLSFFLPALAADATEPLPRAHAHNDYEHPRPLLDALEQGFCSVEADIHLVEGKLLVAHDLEKVRPERTLEALYLDPLLARCRANDGPVFPGLKDPKLRRPLAASAPDVEFTLLIDLKSDGAATYAVLGETLRRYSSILTKFTPTNTQTGPVTVILSGNRPTGLVAAEAERFCAIDGRFPDLEGDTPSVHLVPLVSESWAALAKSQNQPLDSTTWLPRREIDLAHAQGRRIRFWAVPDQPAMWRTLRDGGVDLINTDNLAGLATFLKTQP